MVASQQVNGAEHAAVQRVPWSANQGLTSDLVLWRVTCMASSHSPGYFKADAHQWILLAPALAPSVVVLDPNIVAQILDEDEMNWIHDDAVM
jgi:hypothetical protein